MKKIIVILLLFFFLNCNMIFYKKNQPEPYLSFIKDHYFAEILLSWKERLESPLSGTTKKKDYETEISVIQVSSDRDLITKKILRTIKFNNWILPESVYILNLDPIHMIFFYGKKPEEYGIKKLLGYYYENSENSELFSIVEVKYFLPSPDKKYIFSINNQNYIQIHQINNDALTLFKETPLSIPLNDERFISWDPIDFNKIYLYNNNEVYVYDLTKNSVAKATKFPECINPGTSFGGNIDQEGYQYFFDSNKKNYYRIKLNNYRNFYHKSFINNPNKVQYSCFD